MADTIRVLIFPAGEINSIELHDALSTSVNVEVFGGSSVDRHGPFVFRNYIGEIPLISDPQFIEHFNQVLSDNRIDVVFPTHDTVADYFAEHHDDIRAKVVVAAPETAAICRDKMKTYQTFSDTHFIPTIFELVDAVGQLPVFIKPRIGQGSVGARLVEHEEDLHSIIFEDYVVTEYLSGKEYTVDCLTDKNGQLKIVSPRSRDRTLAGVSVAGKTVALTQEIQEIAQTINDRLKFKGLWFFQVKADHEQRLKLMEISTRCAGTMCLTRARGANLPLLSVYTVMGYDVDVLVNDMDVTVDRMLINRYNFDYNYQTVYFDFDDTLIIREQVHPYSIMFLYQCKNMQKEVVLITKHADDIRQTLRNYAIDPALFAKIIHLAPDDNKIDLMEEHPEGAIFIDNAFTERKYVHDRFKIPVFDVDAIEVLLDWRI